MSATGDLSSGDDLELPPTLDTVDEDLSPLHAALKNVLQADTTSKAAGKLVAKSIKFSFDEAGDLQRVLALMKSVEAAAAAVAMPASESKESKDKVSAALWPAKAFVGLGHELVLIMLMRSKSDSLILWTLRLAARLDLAKAYFSRCADPSESSETKEDKVEDSKVNEEECEFSLLMQCATELLTARPTVSAEVVSLLFEIVGGRTQSAASYKPSEVAKSDSESAALALLKSRPFTKIQRPFVLKIITQFLCGKVNAETYLASIENLNFLLYQHEENCEVLLRNLSDWNIWLVPFLNTGYKRSVIVWQNPDDSSEILAISEGKAAEETKEADRKSKLLDPEFADRARKSFGLEVNILIILLFHTLKSARKTSKMEGVTKTFVELIKRLEKENADNCGDITRVLLHGLLKKVTFRFDELMSKTTITNFLKSFLEFLYVVVDFIFLAETIVGSPLAASLSVNIPDAILTQETLVVLTKILGHSDVKELGSKLETEKLVQRLTNSLALFKELHEFLIAMQDSEKSAVDPAILDETCAKLTTNIHKWKKEAIKGTERRSIFEKPRKSSMFKVAAPTIPTGPGDVKTNRKRFSSLLSKTPFELDNDRILESVKKYSAKVYKDRHDSVKSSIPPTSDLSVVAATAKAILGDKIEAK